MSVCDQDRFGHLYPWLPVSILVLVDVGLRLPFSGLIILYYLVSILVLVDVGLRYFLISESSNAELVSILVLVDVGLRFYLWFGGRGGINEFQSLF